MAFHPHLDHSFLNCGPWPYEVLWLNVGIVIYIYIISKHKVTKKFIQAQCQMNLRCFWEHLSTLHRETLLQPWFGHQTNTFSQKKTHKEWSLNYSRWDSILPLKIARFLPHTYTHTYTHICIHSHAYTHAYTYTHSHKHRCAHRHAYKHMHSHTHMHTVHAHMCTHEALCSFRNIIF